MELVMFSKHLWPMPVREAGEAARGLGFEGLDLTVRPGGHVEPAEVESALPSAVAALAACGMTLPMITTGLTSCEDEHAEAVVATAARCGVRRLKLGYWRYSGFGNLHDQLSAARRQLDGLEALARRHDVRVCVHTHSDRFLSATAAGMLALLQGRDPRWVGAYLDPGHLTLEGAESGWMQAIDLLQGYLAMVAVKSLAPFRDAASGRWVYKMAPLADGMVRWPEVFACLHTLGWNDVLSLHSEYQGAHSWRDLCTEELLVQTRADLLYLRPVALQAGYTQFGRADLM